MTETQFDLLAGTLPAARRDAARLVLFDGLSDGAAEREAHGEKTRTVRRDITRLKAALALANKVVNNAKV